MWLWCVEAVGTGLLCLFVGVCLTSSQRGRREEGTTIVVLTQREKPEPPRAVQVRDVRQDCETPQCVCERGYGCAWTFPGVQAGKGYPFHKVGRTYH